MLQYRTTSGGKKGGFSVGISAFEHAAFYYRDNETAEWAQSSRRAHVSTVRWKSLCPAKPT